MVITKKPTVESSAVLTTRKKTVNKSKAATIPKVKSYKSLSGSYTEIKAQLAKESDELYVVTSFHQDTDVDVKLVAKTFQDMADLLRLKIIDRNALQLEKVSDGLVDALVETVPLPKHILIEARMRSKAKVAVLESGDWLTAAEVAEVAGFETVNPSAQTGKWKAKNIIFSITHKGVDYFPGFALDPANNYRPRAAVKMILDAFAGTKGGWGLAYWFASVNGFLGGRRPQDVLKDDAALVLAAANDAVVGAAHA